MWTEKKKKEPEVELLNQRLPGLSKDFISAFPVKQFQDPIYNNFGFLIQVILLH